MELKDFVSETLQQIVEGTIAAHAAVKKKKAAINPSGIKSPHGDMPYIDAPGGWVTVQMVDFDISLVESTTGEKGGRIAVGFSSIGVSAGAKSESGTGSTNRVKFSVPIMLPSHKPSL